MSRPAPGWLLHLPFLLVLTLAAAGLAVVSMQHVRTGCVLVGVAALTGAALRLVLPARQAGLLVVRGRGLDVVALAGIGVAVLAMSSVVPVVR